MERHEMIDRVGREYLTANIEAGEYSYVKEAGSRNNLVNALGYEPDHYKLDIRFENEDGVVVLIETKQEFVDDDENQLKTYLAEEKALHDFNRIIAILANTTNDRIRVWQNEIDDAHILNNETALDSMEHYAKLFMENSRQNNKEIVLKNTYKLNETLHKKGIIEDLRSQFVGTTLLYIKDVIKKKSITEINKESRAVLRAFWEDKSPNEIRTSIKDTLNTLLDGSDNKTLKINLLQKNVLDNQNVRELSTKDWSQLLDDILNGIYKHINADSSEGQDILNMFFTAFNKYVGKKNKNQAFTPDHITDFMCRVVGVNKDKVVFDGTCGSGAFLVQALVHELIDVNHQQLTQKQKNDFSERVKKTHIFGIEKEENIFGLATTNMLIHGDGNSNVKRADLFQSEDFIRQANPDIILMNPPYNAVPKDIPKDYRTGWKSDSKTDPTKGMVFLKYISDVIKKMNDERISKNEAKKEVKIAILLPVATAIGNDELIKKIKKSLLEENTLDAVFTLPNEVFYPGASASACCMVLTLGKPHVNSDGTVNQTYFGYYREDGHKKKKNLGRVEQFDEDNNSIWKQIEEKWLLYYRNKKVEAGFSAMQSVSGKDEWLCEAYMETDYGKLCENDFQETLNNYLAYQIKEGKINES